VLLTCDEACQQLCWLAWALLLLVLVLALLLLLLLLPGLRVLLLPQAGRIHSQGGEGGQLCNRGPGNNAVQAAGGGLIERSVVV